MRPPSLADFMRYAVVVFFHPLLAPFHPVKNAAVDFRSDRRGREFALHSLPDFIGEIAQEFVVGLIRVYHDF